MFWNVSHRMSAWTEGENGYWLTMYYGMTGPMVTNIGVLFLLGPQLDYISQAHWK